MKIIMRRISEIFYSENLRNDNTGRCCLPDKTKAFYQVLVLNEGKRYIGNTVHFIDEGMDSGPIIMQSMILADNFGQYGYNIFLDGMTELIWRTVNLLESNRIEIADRKVIIKDADYTVSRIFPDFNI